LEKKEKKRGKTLWITVVIHSVLCVGERFKEKKLQNQILNQFNIIKKSTNIILKNKEIK